jgi:hypothetical protein
VTLREHDPASLIPLSRGAERQFVALRMIGIVIFAAYVAATLGGAPRGFLSAVGAALVAPVPFAVWWAYRRAQVNLRLPVGLLAFAATLWLVGALVWYGIYVAHDFRVPTPPGVWDGFYVPARILVILALIVALRSVISFTFAILDAIVLTAAGIALAAPFVGEGLEHGATAASLFTLNRPVLSIVTLMLIVSAALGSTEGMPLSMAMLGLAEIPLMIGNLVYGYQAVQGDYVDDRWADLAWGAGAIVAMLAASVFILGIERVVRLPIGMHIPNHPAGSRSVLLLSIGALGIACGVACYGVHDHSRGVTLAGLIATVVIGVAMAARARDSIATAELAYCEHDRALAETERARDDLAVANEDLRRANVQIQAMHIAIAELLNLADERVNGRIRKLIEETGDELVALLEAQLETKR